jgi:hypothetical protein
MTRKEISEKLRISSGEDLSKMLADLVYFHKTLAEIYINIQTNEKGNEKRYATETTPYYIYSDGSPADGGLHGKRQPESK